MGRKRKYERSYVISMRISDEELRDINHIMEHNQIKRVSDLMRQAIQLIRVNYPGQFPMTGGQEQTPVFQHY